MYSSTSNLNHTSSLQSENMHSSQGRSRFDLLSPLRNWIDTVEIRDRRTAHLISRLIPAQCPFERDIKVFGKVVAHIPP
ncbi:MAG: Mo-dependent nitrogenase C-terminal domain-containing protein, partial [Elainellaceae cyanobacterium]